MPGAIWKKKKNKNENDRELCCFLAETEPEEEIKNWVERKQRELRRLKKEINKCNSCLNQLGDE